MKSVPISAIFVIISLCFLARNIEGKEAPKETESSVSSSAISVADEHRKDHRSSFKAGLSGGRGLFGGSSSSSTGTAGTTGSSSGGGSGLQMIQQGLKGIQSIQKFMSNLRNVIKLPFSFRGVSDTMATMTGLLAAVGGGYLTYVSMVAMFGNMLDPHGQYSDQSAYFAAPSQAQGYVAVPPGYGPGPVASATSHSGGPYRRQSNGGNSLHFGSMDLGKLYNSVKNYDYPEASFKLLRIKDDVCKQRAVCELEKFLAKKGIASVILKGVSKKITGMDKYLDAAYRGLSNEDCSFAYSSCPSTLGQTLLRSIGLN